MSANGGLHTTQAKILGVSESLINLTSGKVTIKHTPYQGAAFGTTSNNSKPSIESKNEVKFEGNMTTGALKLDLSNMLGALGGLLDKDKATADMSTVICPISHKFKIIFAGRESYTITSAYKLMPGSEVIIESGSTVNMNGDLIVYSDAIYSAYYSGSSVVTKASVWKKNPDYRPGAILTVNGQLNVNAGIGGEIRTASSGAVLNLNGSTNLSVSSNESNGTGMMTSECIYTETQAANGIAGMSNAALVNANLAKAEYTSVDYGNGIYGWKQYKVNYSWIFENNTLSDSQIDNSKNPEYYSNGVDVYLQIPTSANPNESPYFEGWYLDAECNTSINKLPVGTGDITVYGKWVDARTYMVSFKTDINCGNASVSIGDYAVAPDASFDPYNYAAVKSAMDEIAQDPSIDHYFVGWYYDEALTNPVPNDGIAQVTDDVVLYAKWMPKAKLTVKSGALSSIHIKTDTDMYKAEFDVTPGLANDGVYYIPGSTLTLKATHSNTGKHSGYVGWTDIKAAVYIKDNATDTTLASGTKTETSISKYQTVTATATATYTVTDAGDLTLKVTTANTY